MYNVLKDFKLHSGGAYGADSYWDIIGSKHGLKNAMHYKPYNAMYLSKELKAKGVTPVRVSEDELNYAKTQIKSLLGISLNDGLSGNLKARNYYQVINSEAVYAIGFINNDMKSVSGGTDIAVQLGIKLNKPTYVWDINTESWMVYSKNMFIKCNDMPVLTQNFAGVGTRDIQLYNVKQGDEYILNPKYVGKEKEKAAILAINNIYSNTKNYHNSASQY